LVEGGNGCVELGEGGSERSVGGGGGAHAGGHQQRKQLFLVSGWVDVQFEFHWMDLGALLIGGEDAGLGSGNGEGSGEVGIVGVQNVKATRGRWIVGIGGDPFGAGCAFVALGPHPAEFGRKAEGEIGGVEAVEFEEDDGGCFRGASAGGGWRKHHLSDGEGGVGIGDDGAVGAYLNGGGLLIDVDRDAVTFDVGFDREVGKKFDRKDPGFEDAVLLANEDAALTGDGEGLERLGVGVDCGAFMIEGHGSDGGEDWRGRPGWFSFG
jgi:hypothetical protein